MSRSGILATTAVALVLSGSVGYAAEFTVAAPSVLQNGGNVLAAGDILTITPTGAITLLGGIANPTVNLTFDSQTLNNSGVIAADAVGVNSTGDNFTFTQFSTGSVTAISGIGIQLGGNSASLTLDGIVQADGPGILGVTAGSSVFLGGTLNSTFSAGIALIGDANVINVTGSITANVEGVITTGNDVVSTNSGTITSNSVGIGAFGDRVTVQNTGSVTSNFDDGLGIIGDNATITNSGAIDAGLDGFFVDGDNAMLSNTCTILAFDDGMEVDGDGGTLSNSGTINAGLAGMFSTGDNAFLLNTGTITSNDPGVGALGDNVTIVNTGLVTSNFSDGLGIVGDNSTITNQGTVFADLDGIYADGDNAMLFNSGSIFALDDGIDIEGTTGGVVTNRGTVVAVRDGIETDSDGVVVNNFGTVIGADDSFDLNGANSVLNIFHGSNVQGLLSFDGANGTLNFGPGVSATFTDDGGTPANVTSAGGTSFSIGNTHYAFSGDAFRASHDHIVNLMPWVQNTADRAFRNTTPDVVARGPGVTRTNRPWLALGAHFTDRDDDSTTAGYTTTSATVLAGIALSDRFGVFVGFDDSTSSRSQSFDNDSSTFLLGVHGETPISLGTLGWSVIAGIVDTKRERTVLNNTVVGGIEIATASQDSYALSPSVRLSRGYDNGLTGEVELRYTHIEGDGYTESGVTAPFTVSSQTSQAFSVSPSVTWERETTHSRFELTAEL